MKIVNCMFSTRLGGLEQVFADYSEALADRGHTVLNVVAPGAGVAPQLVSLGLGVHGLRNRNQFDPIAMWRLRRHLRRVEPDVVIAHGNRAIHLARWASRGVAPLIAVNHSINIKGTVGADFAIAINEDMRERLIAAGQPAGRVARVFNMVRVPDHLPPPRRPRPVPTIGALGRFVAKKGFKVFIEALAALKRAGVPFRAVLAGAGDLEASLKALARSRGLDEVLSFPGWVTDKAAFFDSLDVFCFTSNHDVCPVVLLEAFLYAKPVVLTDCLGPREISADGIDSLLFPVGDSAALAARVSALLADPEGARLLGAAAQAKILHSHTMERTGALLDGIVRRVATAGA